MLCAKKIIYRALVVRTTLPAFSNWQSTSARFIVSWSGHWKESVDEMFREIVIEYRNMQRVTSPAELGARIMNSRAKSKQAFMKMGLNQIH